MQHHQTDTIIPDWLVKLAENDDQIRRKLLTVKDDPEFLAVLIESLAPRKTENDNKNVLRLGTKAAVALAKWAVTGFARAPREVVHARIVACRACPELSTSASGQAWMFLPENQREFCSACGCPISRKAAILSESCPLPSSEQPDTNRWGNPL